MASKEKFQPTVEEMRRLGDAMKDEKFRELLREYAEEISDPENRRKHEEEIRMMEEAQGNDVSFVKPKPGFVVKTVVKQTGVKAFLNICQADNISEPQANHTEQNGRRGTSWSLPHSVSACREDLDKAGKPCVVYDAVFHPKALRLAEHDKRFRKMLIDAAFDSIQRNFPKAFLVREDLKFPNLKFKGNPVATIIRNPGDNGPPAMPVGEASPMGQLETELTPKSQPKTSAARQAAAAPKPPSDQPKYTLTHRGELDLSDFVGQGAGTPPRPKELVVTVELPKCKSAGSLDLTITERQVSLHSIDVGPYHLDLRLPYGVLEDAGSAKFDKKARTLTVVLPVVHPKPEPELMSDTPAISRQEDVVAQDASANTDTSASPQDAESIRTASPVATEASLPATDASAPMPEQLAQPSKQTSQGGDKRAGAVAAEETKPLPIFRMKQTAEAVSVVVDVPGLASSSVDLSFEAAVFGPITTHTAVLRLPAHSLLLKFDAELRTEDCSMDVSAGNVLLTLSKAVPMMWQRVCVGCQKAKLTERKFLTSENVRAVVHATEQESNAAKPATEGEFDVKVSRHSDHMDVTVVDQVSSNHVCPNKSNKYHTCSDYCKQRWGEATAAATDRGLTEVVAPDKTLEKPPNSAGAGTFTETNSTSPPAAVPAASVDGSEPKKAVPAPEELLQNSLVFELD